MKISLEHISKRFQRHWIFKDVNFHFTSPGAYAILGQNGSGKSTLLRIIAGMQSASAGKVFFSDNDTEIPKEKIFSHISFCAPSQEIVEEMTLAEFLKFHFSFKPIYPGLDIEQVIKLTGLEAAKDKQISDYSSGMKQRVKLAQAIFTASPILLLDEPCTNLDDDGVLQYREWIEQYTANKLVIVASNDVREYHFCKERISMQEYK
ncbi:MAG: ABC transporter ATP-binding protein [Chitinophagaceae bacterium]|nr:ABC transporter ATP-binding protein [Chitinophagaceae bacterium]